jgi:protein O-GlcNAc transferase
VAVPTLDQALALYQAGHREGARALAEELLVSQPTLTDALNLLCVIAQDNGRWADAEVHIRRALDISPNTAIYLNSLGNVHLAQGRSHDAIMTLAQAVQAAPNEPDILFNLGNAYREAGRFLEAAQTYEKVIQQRSRHIGAYNNLALVLRASGQIENALTVLIEALGQAPRSVELRFNLGNAMHALGRWDGAEAAYRKALELKPDHTDAMVNLGQVLIQLGRKLDAEALFHRAIALNPEMSQAYVGLADLVDDGSGDAVAHRRAVLALKPDLAAVRSSLLMCLQYDPAVTRAEIAAEHRQFGQLHNRATQSAYAARSVAFDPGRKLNIGVVSGDFRFHAMLFFALPVFAARPRDHVTLTCYSTTIRTDQHTADFRSASDRWRDVRQLPVEDLVSLIVSDGIDILIDLSGHAPHNRLAAFAAKPAPLQVAWGDYVDTRGLSAIDLLLGDSIHTPATDQPHYVERLVQLAQDYVCYQPPTYLPPVASGPALRTGVVTFGCFSEITKINAVSVAQWATVLRAVPGSKMVLNNRLLSDSSRQGRLLSLFMDHGVGAERVEFKMGGAHADFLTQYELVDVVLDTAPYSGGLTTCEALVMGVPVLTVPGDRFCSRHAASHLIHGGYTEGVCTSADNMAGKAKTITADPVALNAQRRALRAKVLASSLCDVATFSAQFYATLRQEWRSLCERPHR